MRILGIDPGLQKTGWGVIEVHGNALSFVSCGLIKTDAKAMLCERLRTLDDNLTVTIKEHAPDEAAIEETFVNKNPASALKLGQARGVGMVVPARMGLMVAEYSANQVKKSIVGSGHAAKQQMGMMVKTLLPSIPKGISEDEADALAVAICHAHHAASRIHRIGAKVS